MVNRTPKTLCVLVTSVKHGAHLPQLHLSAERKNVALAIYLQGEGVRLGLQERYGKVLTRAHLSICRRSAETLGVAEQLQTLFPQALTTGGNIPMRINACTRFIVL